ncbi:helix-turn-helix transcriptional regulator [Mediterraneibacter massiliensis]|uniref:helix-turn-helix transcriptional regulator n=1 Tax=Mediterraneibacter massiliensis TaxID=1720300 RepID=UPI0024AD5A83|nr:helix-turn-helix transcriptional regulator [Mediterraneibacter massiliensis]
MNIPENMRVSLKQARELRGLKQAEAAEKIGISTDTLGNYERGKSYPDIPVLRKIEEVYGIPYDRLIFLPLDFGLTE